MNENIEVNEEQIIKDCPDNRSPIWLLNVWVKVFKTVAIAKKTYDPKGKRSSVMTQRASMIVAKGLVPDLYNSEELKRRTVKQLFSKDSNGKKKSHEFNVDRVKITRIGIIRNLGYGIKE